MESKATVSPKAFISYSWSSATHQEMVRGWANRLLDDGVDVVLDLFDLKEGHDKFAFMERMVSDPNVTHVLVFSDQKYAEKADARKAGVGTESQIISKEIYDKIEQSKFIPVVCEFSDSGEPYLPVFLKSRKWINFATPEAVNENWEQLIRVLHGRPIHHKPALGKPPAYILDDDDSPATPALSKFAALRQAILQEKKGLRAYREDFLNTCYEFADGLRIRKPIQDGSLGEKVVADCGKLVSVRDHLVDWVLLESEAAPSESFSESLISMFERLRELRARPPELSSWQERWFEAHKLFVYETFLYVIAALLKSQSYAELHNIFTSHYLIPETERYGKGNFERFDVFCAYSETLQILAPKGQRLLSPAAELFKRQAQRTDLPFVDIMQAELLVFLNALITPTLEWYPQTLFYAGHSRAFPFFIRASQHRHFRKLAEITGVETADALREAAKVGLERARPGYWGGGFHYPSFSSLMNLDQLDTVK